MIEKNEIDLKKIEAAIAEQMAETAKISAEATWFPFIAVAGVFGAAIAIVKLFLH